MALANKVHRCLMHRGIFQQVSFFLFCVNKITLDYITTMKKKTKFLFYTQK